MTCEILVYNMGIIIEDMDTSFNKEDALSPISSRAIGLGCSSIFWYFDVHPLLITRRKIHMFLGKISATSENKDVNNIYYIVFDWFIN